MAAINFPNSPTIGDTYAANGTTFQWDGVKWKVYSLVPEDAIFNSVKLDDGTSGQAGTLSWNPDDGTLDLVMRGGSVVQQVGLEQFYNVKNQSGITIAKGTPVYVNGVVGSSGHVTVLPMIADGTIPSKRYIGIATETITNGNDGYVTSFGYVRDLDTTGTPYTQTWAEGDIIYVSQTAAGALTNVAPTSGLVLPVAVVVTAHQNVGMLLVRSGPAISATAEDGVLARTALQSGDNVSELANDAGYATQADVTAAVAAVVDSAPAALDTLNELAAALGDDANFASTVTASLAGKQATLVSGTNIKTINSTSLLGSGNVAVQPTLVSGTNIKTINGTSLLGSGDITISGGGGGTATAVTTTASSTNSTFKVPFLNTTGNTTGDYSVLHDTTSNFTYNPSTNTLNNLVLGTGVTLPSAGEYTLGGVYGYTTSSVGTTSYGYGSSAGYQSTALGYDARTTYSYAVVIGLNSRANSDYSIAIGRLAEAGYNGNAQGSISIGHNTSSEYSNIPSTLIGHQVYSGNVSSGNGVVAIRGTNGSSVWDIPDSGFYVDTITTATTSNALYYDTTTKKITYGAAGGGGGALDDLSDVTITNPTSGQVLLYNGTAWVNGTAGEEPPPAADVYRSTIITPLNVSTPNSSTMFVTFATADEATHVRAIMVAIGSDFGSGSIDFRLNGGYSRINFDSNASSWVSVSGSTLQIYNYYAYNSGYWGGPNAVSVRVVPYVVSASPNNSELVIGGNSIGTQLVASTAFGNWKPFSVEWYPGNFAANATTISPAASPTLTPAVTTVTAPQPSNAIFAFDIANNAPSTFSYSDSVPYVNFILGKTVLVDPNAPQPWYTVQGAQGSPSISPSIALPDGYNSAQLAASHKFVGIGNCHNFSGGSQYFYPYGPGMTSGPSIGSVWYNSQTRTFFTNSAMVSPVNYDSQGFGIVSVFAQPIPSNSNTLCAYTKGDTNYDGPPEGFFAEYFSGYLVNSVPVTPPSGGTVKFKSVMIFTNPVTVELFSTYASASGVLLETFSYTDQYYNSTTRYVFLTCTNDTVARQMAADNAPILEFKSSPGGSNTQVTHLAWSWFERTL